MMLPEDACVSRGARETSAPATLSGDLAAALERASQLATPDRRQELADAANAIAAETLADAARLSAFERAADAILSGVRVFVSYKFADYKLASKLRDLIVRYGQRRLAVDATGKPAVFVAQQNVRGGGEWLADVHEAVERAHWFILLLQDAESEREWLLYEAGYFKRGMAHGERLMCVRHKDVAPAPPLAEFQAYDSSAESLENMFTELFFSAGAIPGMKPICFTDSRPQMQADVRELADAFARTSPKSRLEFCMPFVELEHCGVATYRNLDELLAAKVARHQGLDDVFRLTPGFSGTFGALVARGDNPPEPEPWLEELRAALAAVVIAKQAPPLTIPFLDHGDGERLFRPVLHCIQRRGEQGPVERLHIAFVEEPTARIHAPKALDALESSLRWCYRSWFDIYERYGDGDLHPNDVDAIRRYIERAEQEMQTRRIANPELMLNNFKDQPELRAQLDEQQKDYYQNYRNHQTGEGKLDRAFRERDPKLLAQCLRELRPRILWFLQNGTRRYAEMVAGLH